MADKIKKIITEKILVEKYIVWAYIIVFFVDNYTELFFHVFLREALGVVYLWTLFLYVYHSICTKKYFKGRYYIAAQLFLLCNIVLSFIYKENFRFSILQDFASLVFFLFPCYGAVSEVYTERKPDFEKILFVFEQIVFYTSLFSIVMMIANSSLSQIGMEGYSETRAFYRTLYHSYNDICFMAYTALMISLYFIHNRETLKWNGLFNSKNVILHSLNIIVEFFLLYLIQTRAVILGAGVSILFICLYKVKEMFHIKTRTILIFGTISFIVFLYIFAFSKYGTSRNFYYYLLRNGKSSIFDLSYNEYEVMLSSLLSGRFELWGKSIELILLSPIIGWGLKSTGFTTPALPERLQNTHNLFLNSLLYTGIVGTILLAAIIWVVFYEATKKTSKETLSLVAFLYGMLMCSMFEPCILYNWRAASVIFWVIAGYLSDDIKQQITTGRLLKH